jgi:hypothetical protein
VAVLAAVVAILLCAAWSLTSAPRPSATPRPVRVAVTGGVAHLASPSADSPAASGEAPVSAEVALLAAGDQPLEYHVGAFEHVRPGGTPRRPRRAVLPSRQLPLGTRPSGTVVFDLPADSTRAALWYEDPAATVDVLPKESRAPPRETSRSSASDTPPTSN